jgi:hypothetical protein
MQPEFFYSIPIVIPQEAIRNRLGFRKGLTQLKVPHEKELAQRIDEASALLDLKGVALRLAIKEKETSRITLNEGTVFTSSLFAALCKDCDEALFMGVTAGSRIIERIHQEQKNNLTASVIYDAVASEMTDACFNWIQEYFTRTLVRENKQHTAKRVSVGFGDFSLSYQKVFFEVLNLQRLGITLTQKYMLVPEKSATAVTGIITAYT